MVSALIGTYAASEAGGNSLYILVAAAALVIGSMFNVATSDSGNRFTMGLAVAAAGGSGSAHDRSAHGHNRCYICANYVCRLCANSAEQGRSQRNRPKRWCGVTTGNRERSRTQRY